MPANSGMRDVLPPPAWAPWVYRVATAVVCALREDLDVGETAAVLTVAAAQAVEEQARAPPA
jgi:hypothetical protein